MLKFLRQARLQSPHAKGARPAGHRCQQCATTCAEHPCVTDEITSADAAARAVGPSAWRLPCLRCRRAPVRAARARQRQRALCVASSRRAGRRMRSSDDRGPPEAVVVGAAQFEAPIPIMEAGRQHRFRRATANGLGGRAGRAGGIGRVSSAGQVTRADLVDRVGDAGGRRRTCMAVGIQPRCSAMANVGSTGHRGAGSRVRTANVREGLGTSSTRSRRRTSVRGHVPGRETLDIDGRERAAGPAPDSERPRRMGPAVTPGRAGGRRPLVTAASGPRVS
jgi:hypothetical protein